MRARQWRHVAAMLAFLGPGIITGAAGDDAGGIATYASIGAQYAGIAAATDIFDARLVAPVVLVSAVMAWLIVVRGSYTVAEKVFIALSVALLTYVGAALLARPAWGEVGLSLVTPRMQLDSDYLTTFVALVGTTITPYMLFYLQSSLSDKGVTLDDYPAERTDVIVGSLLTTVVAVFIIVSTAATLHPEGIVVDTADDAARALEPLAGPYARILFGLGLFGASMLAASVLPLSTAYAVCGAFGWERGVSSSWSQAPMFNGLYTALIAMGAAFVLIPGLPLIQVIVATQFLNGLLLPIVLAFVLRLVNDRDLMGTYTNSRLFNVLSYATTAVMVVLTVALLIFTLFGIG